jgi:ABC-type multidrug transport system ATPase subunit
LVTHAIDFIHLADRIVILNEGKIAACGKYEELQDNEQFQNLIKINEINKDNNTEDTNDSSENGEETENFTIQENEIEEKELTDEEKIEKFKTIGRVSKDSDGKLITDENKEKVEVTFKSYSQLVKYGGGWTGIIWNNIF